MKSFEASNYPVIVERKAGYLIVKAPDFGFQISDEQRSLPGTNEESLAFFRIFEMVRVRIEQIIAAARRSGDTLPKPGSGLVILKSNDNRWVKMKEAMRVTGHSDYELRVLEREKKIQCRRSPKGTREFFLKSLLQFAQNDAANHNE